MINCAAISVPRACEQDPEAAMAVNVPTVLVQWLNSLDVAQPPFLVHLSTDQGMHHLNPKPYHLVESASLHIFAIIQLCSFDSFPSHVEPADVLPISLNSYV